LSPKFKMNSHPKNCVKWRPSGHGFFEPHNGASKMKWNFRLPYVRMSESLHHYPEVSRVTGKPIDWLYDTPDDGYEGLRMFGEHTLELEGMPLGRTPEYMQERLRRFFSKFGPVTNCRAEPHPADPYQCDGKAWVTFRDKGAALKALRSPLKFPASLHDKIVSMRHLETDKRNDPDYYEKSKFWNEQLVSIARQLHVQLSSDETFRASGKPLRSIGEGLWERELVAAPWVVDARGRGGVPVSRGLHGAPSRLVAAESAVARRFGGWERFLAEAPMCDLFRMEADGERVVVRPLLVSTTQRARILKAARLALAKRLHEEFSMWWRKDRIALPEYTQRRVSWWEHKPPLPFELQIQSRSKDVVKIFDEKFLYKRQLIKARNQKRNELRAEFVAKKKEEVKERERAKIERRDKALAVIGRQRCSGLIGRSPGLVSSGLEAARAARELDS